MQVNQNHNHLLAIIEILACPGCRASEFIVNQDSLFCQGCSAIYPIHQDVPVFSKLESAEVLNAPIQTQTSINYQKKYQGIGQAQDYNESHQNKTYKRKRTKRELDIIKKLLCSQPPSELVLDLPSGGGRLSPAIAKTTQRIIEADISMQQVQYSRRYPTLDIPQSWMTASAFHIPLQDQSVDGAVCARLTHHLPTKEEKSRLISELFRVAKRFVLLSFADRCSTRNLSRRLRGKPIRSTVMSVSEVKQFAEQHGARLTACPSVSLLGSRHRYALLVKE